jgi:hypothetical protein
MGRSHFAVAYIGYKGKVSIDLLDDMRRDVIRACRSVHEPSRMEIIYTGKAPFA